MPGAPTYVLTFASTSQAVEVSDECSDVTNGAFKALPAAKWVDQIRQYIATQSKLHAPDLSG